MKPIANDTDVALLLLMQQHNEQALARLMKNYYNSLYNYAGRFTKDESLVKDAIQEVFISLWQRRATAGSIVSPRFYLLRAVKNKVLKALHKKNNRDTSLSESDYNFDVEFSIEKKIIEKQVAEEKASKLKTIIAGLSARQREIIYLKFYQQLDHGQIAGLMSINQQSVYNLLHESIQRLKKCWQSEFLMKVQ